MPVEPAALPLRVGILAFAAAAMAAGWMVARHPPYTSGSSLGYSLGLAGGSMMLVLLLYPLRKHSRLMQECGHLKHWFRAHMIGGILGPVLILFHSTFRVGSFNAAVALGCMLLVVASGLVGRFLYRHVHHGLYGSRSTLRETQQALLQQLTAVAPRLQDLPQLRDELERFISEAGREPPRWDRRAVHFATLGWKRAIAWRRIRCVAGTLVRARDGVEPAAAEALLLQTVDRTLRAAVQAAQFSSYERMFALWHVVHIPFLCMLVITAIIHVVAVHAY